MRTFFILITAVQLVNCTSNKQQTSFNYDHTQPQLSWAINQLEQQLHQKTETDPTVTAVNVTTTSESSVDEGYYLTIENGVVSINGNDVNGTMYGILELTEQIRNGKLETTSETARFPFRAIKVNLPWDSYRRSEALQLHMETMQDIRFWEKFLDMMATNRFNVLTLWNLHPFNYMIRPTNFPEACGFDDAELAKWQTFWHSLFKMARDRGIDTYIVNWNIFVSPEFAEKYKTAEYSKEGAFFTDGDTSAIVKQYTRECVTQLINEYPDLTGVGITLGEGMGAMTPVQREKWLLETIIAGAREANRKIKFIHRVPLSANKNSGGSTDRSVEQMTRETLDTLTCFETPIWTEFKFNWSHAHSSTDLVKVHGGPLTDAYWNPLPENYSINWMMRNEDFFILRWGQSDFIREHIYKNGHPFVSGYYIGSECYYPAVDYFSKAEDNSWDYAFERQWLFYKQWGRLLYNPSTAEDVFENEFNHRFEGDGQLLNRAWNLAGTVPLTIASFWNGTWDFTLYSEGFLAQFDNKIGTTLIPAKELLERQPLDPDYMSIKEYAESETVPDGMIDPITLANKLEKDCMNALEIANSTKRDANSTLKNELDDIKAWSYLGLYFSEKLRSCVVFYKYKKGGDMDEHFEAILHMQNAAKHWDSLVEVTASNYKEVPLVHLNNTADKYFHWSKYSEQVKSEIEWIKNN